MTVPTAGGIERQSSRGSGSVTRSTSSRGSSLVDVLDHVLDKGIVIDAWVRISVLGLDLVTIEARIVLASVDTYLKYAEAIGATALAARPQPHAEPQQQPQGQQAQQNGHGQQQQQWPQGLPQQQMYPQQQLPQGQYQPQQQGQQQPQGQQQMYAQQPQMQQAYSGRS